MARKSKKKIKTVPKSFRVWAVECLDDRTRDFVMENSISDKEEPKYEPKFLLGQIVNVSVEGQNIPIPVDLYEIDQTVAMKLLNAQDEQQLEFNLFSRDGEKGEFIQREGVNA